MPTKNTELTMCTAKIVSVQAELESSSQIALHITQKIFLSNAQFQDKKTSHAGCRSVYIFQRK